MNDPATWALVEGLENLDQMESSCKEDISKSRLMASRDRLISAKFCAYIEGDETPQLKRFDLVEAKNFARLAEIEEGCVASLTQLLAKLAARRRRMLVRLEESRSLE